MVAKSLSAKKKKTKNEGVAAGQLLVPCADRRCYQVQVQVVPTSGVIGGNGAGDSLATAVIAEVPLEGGLGLERLNAPS